MALNKADTVTQDAPFEADATILAEPTVLDNQQLAQPVQSALTTPGATTAFEADLAEDGYEGLELDRFSFDQIKIDDGQFLTGEDTELGKSLTCVILATKAKWVLRNTKCDDSEQETHFSYDRVTDANTGEDLAAVIADWKDAGWGSKFSQYLEAQAAIQSGPLEDTIAVLSIPPTSRTRLSGKIRRAQMQLGIHLPSEVLLECRVGKKVQGKNNKTYNPWEFEVLRKLEDDERVEG